MNNTKNDYINKAYTIDELNKRMQDPDYCLPANDWKSGLLLACRIINERPIEDVVEVKHGHWKHYSTTMMECSSCKRHVPRHKYEFCPYCGAIMKGGII